MDEVDTKALRQLQFELNMYIDRICTGDDTGLHVHFCETLLREISRNGFDDVYRIGELLRLANSQGSRAISVLALVSAAIVRRECTIDDLNGVFGSSATAWKFGQVAKSELFDFTTCWREFDAVLKREHSGGREGHLNSDEPEQTSQTMVADEP
jgi:hypothetical protein